MSFFRLGLAQLAHSSHTQAAEFFGPSFWVEWPLGWEIETHGSALAPQELGPRPGKIKARTLGPPRDSAAIELSFAPRASGDNTTLAEALGDSLDYLGEHLAGLGFEVEIEPGGPTTLGGLPAVEARLTGTSPNGRTIRQWILVAFGDSQAYSLSFTAEAVWADAGLCPYRRHLETFTRLRLSMLLA